MTALYEQADLFNEPKDNATLAWEKFASKNPYVLGQIIRMVAQAKDRGESEISILTCLGMIRKQVMRDGEPVAVNNSYAPVVARQIISERPDLADMIKTRRRHTS